VKITQNISALSSALKDVLGEVKQLEKEYKKLKTSKKKKTSVSSQKNDEINLTPLKISDTLTKFLSLEKGAMATRKQARDCITAYIKTNSLQDKDRMFKFD
jgi:hypothetical protein